MNESRVSRSALSSGATDGSSRPRTQAARSLICIAHASAMLSPAIVDERAASVSRVPSHSGQVEKVTARSTNARTCGCSASTSFASIDLRRRGTRPSYVRLMPSTLILTGSACRRWASCCLLYERIGRSMSKPAPAKIRPYQPSIE